MKGDRDKQVSVPTKTLEDSHNPTETLTESNNVYRVQRHSNYTIYTKNGLKHRTHGPALTIGDMEYYYVNGTHYTKEQHNTYKSLHKSYSNAPIYTSMGVDIQEEELYYLMASESPTSIYTVPTSTTSTID